MNTSDNWDKKEKLRQRLRKFKIIIGVVLIAGVFFIFIFTPTSFTITEHQITGISNPRDLDFIIVFIDRNIEVVSDCPDNTIDIGFAPDRLICGDREIKIEELVKDRIFVNYKG